MVKLDTIQESFPGRTSPLDRDLFHSPGFFGEQQRHPGCYGGSRSIWRWKYWHWPATAGSHVERSGNVVLGVSPYSDIPVKLAGSNWRKGCTHTYIRKRKAKKGDGVKLCACGGLIARGVQTSVSMTGSLRGRLWVSKSENAAERMHTRIH